MREKKQVKFKCPSCKAGKTVVKQINYQLKTKSGKKLIVPDLEIEECDRCGERIFSLEAARKVEAYKTLSGRLLIRLKPELHAQLRELAKKHQRSLNQEINFLLESGIRKAS